MICYSFALRGQGGLGQTVVMVSLHVGLDMAIALAYDVLSVL